MRNHSDLILLDIMMPELDGYEVCARLKAEASTRDIPFLFTSSLDTTEDKVNAFSWISVDSEDFVGRIEWFHLRANLVVVVFGRQAAP